MPAGLEVTVPPPTRPLFVTVSGKVWIAKAAVAERPAVMVTVQVDPETESQPLQPVKREPTAGAAVSVTTVL